MKGIVMNQWKVFALVACVTLFSISTASANPWNHPHRYRYGYGGPIYGYPPVVVAPPPVVVAPAYPAPAYVAPAPVVYPPPPVYTYGAIGPRRYGFGYASPGFGVYIGR